MNPHIVLTTFGSLGDLHPYIAVGMSLRERGARVTIATSEIYRENVTREGLAFHPVRPDLAGLVNDPEVIARALHPRSGGPYILKKLLWPCLQQSFDDLLPLAKQADLLVGHAITFATPVVADLLGKPWFSATLQPAGVLSAYDPTLPAGALFMEHLRGLGPAFWRPLIAIVTALLRHMGKPINALRTRVGLPPASNPILDSMYSPHGKQCWFPNILVKPQPDWPPNMQITGYPFYDEGGALTPELTRFLDAGPAPVVFTMGSAAVFDAGTFYRDSADAAQRAGCRAVLLIGRDSRNQPLAPLPDSIITAEYAPYAALFPRAAAIVHQGGIGTTSQALRSGRPMIFVPHCHDQPDNARRVANLGCARIVRRTKYNAVSAAEAITDILTAGKYATAAQQAGTIVRSETGAATAAELILNHPGIQ